jgi:hypothetical protein
MDIGSSFYSSRFQGIWVDLLLGDITVFFGSSVERLSAGTVSGRFTLHYLQAYSRSRTEGLALCQSRSCDGKYWHDVIFQR